MGKVYIYNIFYKSVHESASRTIQAAGSNCKIGTRMIIAKVEAKTSILYSVLIQFTFKILLSQNKSKDVRHIHAY